MKNFEYYCEPLWRCLEEQEHCTHNKNKTTICNHYEHGFCNSEEAHIQWVKEKWSENHIV